MRHILRAEQFDRPTLEQFFKRADEFAEVLASKDPDRKYELRKICRGQILHNIFMEDSTRTDVSFRTAAYRLGMDIIPVVGWHMSSANKGEGRRHTFDAFFANDPDVVVLRHPVDGAAEEAAAYNLAPVINAGDGKNEHPPQAILDIYTIYQQFGQVDGVTVLIGGDLAYGRTTRSLSLLLSRFKDVKIRFIAPEVLRISDDINDKVTASGTSFEEFDKLEEAVADRVEPGG